MEDLLLEEEDTAGFVAEETLDARCLGVLSFGIMIEIYRDSGTIALELPEAW